jgi:hypothetical protein
MATETLIVIAETGVRVRSRPGSNAPVVGSVAKGTRIEVLPEVRQEADGFIWRRVVATETQWVAEFNTRTGQKLCDSTSPQAGILGEETDSNEAVVTITVAPAPMPEATEEIVVQASLINLRDQPTTRGVQVGQARQNEWLLVYRDRRIVDAHGWVWRRLVGATERWAAEMNQQSGQRLLRPVQSVGVQGRARIDQTRFRLDGNPFRFVGANLREFVFYGQPFLQYTTLTHQDRQLEAVRNMQMRVVRIYACHRRVATPQAIALLRSALDKIQQYGLVAIVVLNDSVGLSDFYVPGDERFHSEVLGHLHKTYFTDQRYRENYLPFVELTVTALKEHLAISAWELGNEYAIHPQPATNVDGQVFLAFAHHVSEVVRHLDPNHLITTGLINTGQVMPAGYDARRFCKELYDWPYLDFATVHFYQDRDHPEQASEEARSLVDLDILQVLGKPLIVEEFGAIQGTPNRYQFLESRLQQWFSRGAAGFMQWGLSATGMDVGVGDNEYGMDNFSPGNAPFYEAYCNLYRQWAQMVTNG